MTAQVSEFAAELDKLIGDAATTPRQKAALVSFAYNVGLHNLSGSTLLKMHRAANHAGAAAQFACWDKANGKVVAGLVRRRAAEARMYEGLNA